MLARERDYLTIMRDLLDAPGVEAVVEEQVNTHTRARAYPLVIASGNSVARAAGDDPHARLNTALSIARRRWECVCVRYQGVTDQSVTGSWQ